MLPLFDKAPVRTSIPFPIAFDTPYYVEYWSWFRNGQADDAAPNEIAGDPHMTYARRLGYRHGRMLRPLPFVKDDR